MGGEEFRKCRITLQNTDDVRPFHPADGRGSNRGRAGRPQRSPRQATFTEKITAPQNRDHRFLSALGHDGQLRIAIPDVENGIGFIALVEDCLSAPVFLGGRISVNAFGQPSAIKRKKIFVGHC
jgi:hypothetical protein